MNELLRAAGLLRTAELSEAHGAAVRRAAGRGAVQRLRAGAYVGTDRWKQLDDIERHQLQIHAAVAAV